MIGATLIEAPTATYMAPEAAPTPATPAKAWSRTRRARLAEVALRCIHTFGLDIPIGRAQLARVFDLPDRLAADRYVDLLASEFPADVQPDGRVALTDATAAWVAEVLELELDQVVPQTCAEQRRRKARRRQEAAARQARLGALADLCAAVEACGLRFGCEAWVRAFRPQARRATALRGWERFKARLVRARVPFELEDELAGRTRRLAIVFARIDVASARAELVQAEALPERSGEPDPAHLERVEELVRRREETGAVFGPATPARSLEWLEAVA